MSFYKIAKIKKTKEDGTKKVVENLCEIPSRADVSYYCSQAIQGGEILIFLDRKDKAFCGYFAGTKVYFTEDAALPAKAMTYRDSLISSFKRSQMNGTFFWKTVHYMTGMDTEREIFCDMLSVDKEQFQSILFIAIAKVIKDLKGTNNE